MARRIRLLLVGAPRALRGDFEASGLEVIGEVPDGAAIGDDIQPDVVLVGAPQWLDAVADLWQARTMPALVVMADDPRAVPDVARLGAPGWALVARDSTGAELSAAIVAASHGFALQPASVGRTDEDADDHVPLEALTARERDVLELLSEGLPNKAIAARLAISEHTVKFHLSSIFSKLGVSSRTEAVRRGVRAGLISL